MEPYNIFTTIIVGGLFIMVVVCLRSNTFWRKESFLLNVEIQALRITSDRMYKNFQRQMLAPAEQFVNNFFENEPLDTVIKISDTGKLIIKIGANGKMVDVDIEVFSKDPISALESAKTVLYNAE